MARPGLLEHRKFLRFVRGVGSRPLALGTLELVWASAHKAASPLLGDEDDIASLVEWTGPPKTLVALLLDAGFLDERGDGTYEVHDFWDHAPQYVIKRAKREKERLAIGKTLRDVYSEAGIKGAKTRWSRDKRIADGYPVAIQWPVSGNNPLDNSLESPEPQNLPSTTSSAERKARGAPAPLSLPLLTSLKSRETPEDLQALWNANADRSLPGWKEMPEKRRGRAAKALKERPLSGWLEVIETMNGSRFLLGENERGWRASPDWLLRPGIAAKVLEGAYHPSRLQIREQTITEKVRAYAGI